MKPTKNHVFCRACNRSKMLFESKGKADNFIKYNKEEILDNNEKAPVRSYFCSFCCGWHVTSNPSAESAERFDAKDQQLIDNLTKWEKRLASVDMAHKKELSAMTERLNEELIKFDIELGLCHFDEAEDIIEALDLEISCAGDHISRTPKAGRLRERIGKAKDRLDTRRRLYLMTDEEQDALMSKPDKTTAEKNISAFIGSTRAMKKVLMVFHNRENIKSCEDEIRVNDIVLMCRELITQAAVGSYATTCRKRLNEQLDEILIERKLHFAEQEQSLPAASAGERAGDGVITSTEEPNENIEGPMDSYVFSDEYKANILDLIEKIEKISSLYESEDFYSCEDLLDICNFIVEDMGISNEQISIIKQQLAHCKEQLEKRKNFIPL